MNAPHVLVDDVHAGVWCRVPGVDRAGQPVSVSGAVIGGPELVGDRYAVEIRPYTGAPDLVVYVEPGTPVTFDDDAADEDAQRAHALAPVWPRRKLTVYRAWYGAGSRIVAIQRHDDVTPEQLEDWSRGGHEPVTAEQVANGTAKGRPLLHAVYWGDHTPFPDGVL